MSGVDLLAETNKGAQAILLSGVQNVLLDFIPGSVTLAPVRLRRERIRIHMGLHVTGTARIAVVAPGTADLRVLFQDHNSLNAGLAPLDRHARAAKSGT